MSAKNSAPQVAELLKSDSAELRKISAYVLGAIGDKKYSVDLRKLLNDPSTEVRWNAALGLARLGDKTSLDTLSQMVKRETYSQELLMDEENIETVMINAVKGLSLIATTDSGKILEDLSKNDKSLKVRQAALDALRLYKEGLVR